MALNSYTALKTAIADWLNRPDDAVLRAAIPDFVTLAEAEIKRRLRRTTVRDTITIDAASVTPPTDMAELRSVYLVTGSQSQDVPIRVGTPEMVAERRARAGGATGRPTDVAVFNSELLFAPDPDQEYEAEIIYFATFTALSSSNASNAVLVEAPDAYLYGALLQAEPYLLNDERVATWQRKFDNAIEQLNLVRSNEEYGASLRAARLPMNGFS